MMSNISKKMEKKVLACGVSLLAIGAGATSLAPASAFAQDAAAQTGGLDQITVAAQRREENLQSTPLAITAATGAQLKELNVETLLDLGAVAPNVMMGSQSLRGSTTGGFFIRGIGQDRSGPDFDQGVGLYVDGVYVSRSDNSFLNIVDVERIEILRGPQGTLFGKNTIGGAINYITKKPGEEFGGSIEGTYGSYDRADVIATVDVPLTDRLFAKATFGSLNRKGFLEHVFDEDKEGDVDTRVGRLQLRALLSDVVTVDLSASKINTRNSGRAYVVDFIDPNDFAIVQYRNKTMMPFDERFVSPDFRTRYGGDETSYEYDGYNLAGTITLDFSEAFQVKSITGYMEADSDSFNDWDGTNASVFDTVDRRNLDQFSQEVQFSGNLFGDRLTYVAGFYFLKETPTNAQVLTAAFLPTFPDGPRVRAIDVEVESYAVFWQSTFDITNALSLTGGLRYSKDEKQIVTLQTYPTSTTIPDISGNDSDSWDDVSPRVALEYEWSDNIMTYASATKGFRSGGINARFTNTTDFTDFEPETVWNYEAGIRADILDNRLRVNLTGFYMDYKQQQLTARDIPTNTVFIQNVGEGTRKGIELEMQAAPTEQLHLHGSLGLLDAEYDDVGTARDVTVDSVVLRSPEVTFTVGGSYEIPIDNGATLTPSFNFNYRSEQSTTSSDTNTVLLDGYGLLSGRLQYTSPDEVWGLAVFATNLLDKEYFIGGFDFARNEGFLGVSQLDVGRPREIGVTLDVNF